MKCIASRGVWRTGRRRGGEREGGEVRVFFSFCVCVYSYEHVRVRVHLDSIYASRVFLNRLCMFQFFSPGESVSLIYLFFFITSRYNASLFLSLSCLHVPPCVPFSLSITFSGSPGQPVKCCNLSLSPILTLPLPPLPVFPLLLSQPSAKAPAHESQLPHVEKREIPD